MTRARSARFCALLALAVTACGEPARVDGRTLGEHLARIQATPPQMRGPLVAGLGAFGAAGDGAIPSLTIWLRSDPELRAAAGSALGEIGTAAAQRALADALADASLDEHVVDVAVVPLARSCAPERFAAALRTLAGATPRRAARILVTDAVFATALADATLRRDFVRELAGRIGELDARAQAAVLRRAAGLAPPLDGSEALLADALARGVAVPDAIDALVALGTPAAFAVVAERLARAATDRRLVDAVPRFVERGACDATAAAQAVEAAAGAADPQLRTAAIDALVALATADPTLGTAVFERLDAALADRRASVEDAARAGIVTLVARGVIDPAATAAAWAARIDAMSDVDAAARLCSAMPEIDPSGAAVTPLLARLGATAPLAVADRAEQALAAISTRAARDARAVILARRGLRNAAVRAVALVDDPALDAAGVRHTLTVLGTAEPCPAFVAGLLGRLDARIAAGSLAAAECTSIEAALLADDTIAPAVRAAAARRLLATAADRARIRVLVGERQIDVRLLVDGPLRATSCAEIADQLGALQVLPHVGPLEFDRSSARGPRAVIWFGDDWAPIATDAPGTTRARRADGRAALLMPIGAELPDAVPAVALPTEVLRALAR